MFLVTIVDISLILLLVCIVALRKCICNVKFKKNEGKLVKFKIMLLDGAAVIVYKGCAIVCSWRSGEQ